MNNKIAIIFGDLEIAEADQIIPKSDSKGTPGFDIILLPSQRLVQKYNLREGYHMTKEHKVVRWFPKDAMIFYPESQRVLVLYGFRGEKTNASLKYDELLDLIQNLRTTISTLKGQIAYQSEMLQLMSQHQSIYWDFNIDMIKKINSVRGRLDEAPLPPKEQGDTNG